MHSEELKNQAVKLINLMNKQSCPLLRSKGGGQQNNDSLNFCDILQSEDLMSIICEHIESNKDAASLLIACKYANSIELKAKSQSISLIDLLKYFTKVVIRKFVLQSVTITVATLENSYDIDFDETGIIKNISVQHKDSNTYTYLTNTSTITKTKIKQKNDIFITKFITLIKSGKAKKVIEYEFIPPRNSTKEYFDAIWKDLCQSPTQIINVTTLKSNQMTPRPLTIKSRDSHTPRTIKIIEAINDRTIKIIEAINERVLAPVPIAPAAAPDIDPNTRPQPILFTGDLCEKILKSDGSDVLVSLIQKSAFTESAYLYSCIMNKTMPTKGGNPIPERFHLQQVHLAYRGP